MPRKLSRSAAEMKQKHHGEMKEKAKAQMYLTGGQAKLDKNKNNRIDAEDFKLLRAGKKKGGMFRGYNKVFATAAGPGSTGTSTIVGVKPNPKKPRKTFKSMEEMRKAKGFKAGETAAQFNKRKAAESFAKKAAKATGARGKIALGVAAAGVGAIQYLKNKMKKNKEKKAEKKMGGGLMAATQKLKAKGLKAGGPMGPSGRGLGRAATSAQVARRAGPRNPKTIKKIKQKNLEDRAYEAGVSNVFSNFRQGLKKAEKKYASIPSGMKKDPDTDADIKIKLIKSSRKDPFKEMDDSRREVFATERMGGGMMNKPMGYKAGKSVKVKCKIGKNKPTKMY